MNTHTHINGEHITRRTVFKLRVPVKQILARHHGVLAGADGFPDSLQILSHAVDGAHDIRVLGPTVSVAGRCRTACGRVSVSVVVGDFDVVEFAPPPGQRALLEVRQFGR